MWEVVLSAINPHFGVIIVLKDFLLLEDVGHADEFDQYPLEHFHFHIKIESFEYVFVLSHGV